jgi:hypothetical protein
MRNRKTTTAQAQPRSDADLDSRYGAIGISAVVAALEFKREVKNPAYAPAAARPQDEQLADIFADIAA